MSDEQWACEACLPRGGLGGPPPEFFGESKCPEIDSGGIWH